MNKAGLKQGHVIQLSDSLVAPLCGASPPQAVCAAMPWAQEHPLMRHAAKRRDEDNGLRGWTAWSWGSNRRALTPVGGCRHNHCLFPLIAEGACRR